MLVLEGTLGPGFNVYFENKIVVVEEARVFCSTEDTRVRVADNS